MLEEEPAYIVGRLKAVGLDSNAAGLQGYVAGLLGQPLIMRILFFFFFVSFISKPAIFNFRPPAYVLFRVFMLC